MLKWLNVDAEASISQFEVLSIDDRGIAEQQAACDDVQSIAKVILCYMM